MKTNVCFKIVIYGQFKGDTIAVLTDTRNKGFINTFALFEGHGDASIDFIQSKTRNATKNEYLATYNNMVNKYDYDINIVNKLSK